MGGEYGSIMKPVLRIGESQECVFNDLSSRSSATEEYALANRLLREMKPMSMVMDGIRTRKIRSGNTFG